MLDEVLYYDDINSKYGIFSNPVIDNQDLPLVIFLNAGLVNRQGPNRLYVNMCQDLRALGFKCFRFDLPGIGDTVNNSRLTTKSQIYIHELRKVVSYFKDVQGIESFVLLGLCTGSDLAYDYALADNAIHGVCMVNGTRLPKGNSTSNINTRYYKKYLTDLRRWAKFISLKKVMQVPKYALMVMMLVWQKILSKFAGNRVEKVSNKKEGNTPDVDAKNNWLKLLNSNIEILQIVAEGSETFDDLLNLDSEITKVNASRKNYQQHIIYDADHTFTSITSQQHLSEKIISWLGDRFVANYAVHCEQVIKRPAAKNLTRS